MTAVEHVLQPRLVAVVGASRRPGSVGAAVMANLVAGGFTGPILPVNRRAATIEGLPAYASLHEVPETPELAVVAVPAGPPPAGLNRLGRGELRRGRRTVCGWKASSTAL